MRPTQNEKSQTPKRQLSPVVAVLMALTLLGLGIGGLGTVVDEFKAGETFTLAVVWGQGAKVHRDISPVFFWINLGWQILIGALLVALSIGLLREMVLNHGKGKK